MFVEGPAEFVVNVTAEVSTMVIAARADDAPKNTTMASHAAQASQRARLKDLFKGLVLIVGYFLIKVFFPFPSGKKNVQTSAILLLEK
jgi:hypothetical protein